MPWRKPTSGSFTGSAASACRRTRASLPASSGSQPTRETRTRNTISGYEQARGGLPQDYGEAARLYKLAADQGSALGRTALGILSATGLGGLPKDDREAVRLFKLAADQGNAPAQFDLGLMYEHGRGGLPRDEEEAARLYKRAADQANANAQSALKRLGR
jgi:TPR repeat protein